MVTLLAVAAVLAGCSGARGQAGRPPGFTTCGDGGNGWCGYVSVPLDWTRPDGQHIGLRVLVLPATGDSRAPDPLFYLAGYGGAATSPSDVAWATRTFQQVHQTRDLVFVDQRGLGGSSELTCQPSLGEGALAPEQAVAAAKDCLAAATRTPRFDTTPSAVRDLDRVRVVLGYQRINLYGGSYGVTAGLANLQRYDEHVRSAVFESGSLLDVPLWQLVPTSAQESFDQVVLRCEQTPSCASTYRPAADLAAVVGALRVRPAQIVVGGQTFSVDLPHFLSAVIDDYLSSPQAAVLLPADLHALALGQWAAVVHRRGLDARLDAFRATRMPMEKITVGCSDAWARMDQAAITAQSSSAFGPAISAKATWWDAVCRVWPHDQGASGPVRTSAPVVFLNGTADPADPPANVAGATRTMPNARLVSVPGGGHGVVAGCLVGQVNDFITYANAGDESSWDVCTTAFGAQLPAFPTTA